MALVLSCALIAVCTVVRLVGQQVDNAERERSRRQWHVMCEALGLQDLAADADEPSITSPSCPSPAPTARESTLTDAVAPHQLRRSRAFD